MTRWTAAIVAVLAGAVWVGGCRPSEKEKERARQRVKDADPASRLVLDAATVNQMILDARSASGDKKWKGRVVRVTGTVTGTESSTRQDDDGKTRHTNEVRLLMPEYAAAEIKCICDKDLADYVKGLKTQDTVTLFGEVRDVSGATIELIGCTPKE